MNARHQKASIDIQQKALNLEQERKIVEMQTKAHYENHKAEMQQADIRRKQMASNITTSLKLRRDIDGKQAEALLTNEEKINKIKRNSDEAVAQAQSPVRVGPQINVNPTLETIALQNLA